MDGAKMDNNNNDDYLLPWLLVTTLTILTLVVWALR